MGRWVGRERRGGRVRKRLRKAREGEIWNERRKGRKEGKGKRREEQLR